MATYYVATTGNDTTGTGAIGSPWLTLAKALSVVNAGVGGDTIILRSGTYAETGAAANRLTKPDVTIKAYGKEKVHLTAPLDNTATKVTLWIGRQARRTKVEDLEISGAYYAVKFDEGTNRSDIPGGVGTHIKRCKVHSTYGDGIKVAGGVGNRWDALFPGAEDVLIEDCEIYSTRQGASTNGQGIDNVLGHRMIVRRCWFHDIPNDAACIIKGGAEDCIIQNCVIQNCAVGIAAGQDSGEDNFDHVNNPKSYEAVRMLVQGNLIAGCLYAGIQTWASKDCRILDNTLYDVAQAGQGGLYVTYHDHYDWSAADGTHTTEHRGCEGLEVRNNSVTLLNASKRFGVYVQTFGYQKTVRPTFAENRFYHVGKVPQVFDYSQYPAYFLGPLSGWAAYLGT